jgi:Glycosyltransferase family 9 (heptosyltransferase)
MRREVDSLIKLAPYWDGFGDLWAITSYSCLLSQRAGRPVHLSKWSTKSMMDREDEIRDILANLDDGYTKDVVVTTERFATSSRFSVRDHHDSYVPTKVKWVQHDSGVISYQLETSTSHRPGRFCNPWLIEDLSDQLPGYEFIEVGKQRQSTLSEIIEILSQSTLFVGIDSGMSHVAHSVGVPVFLKRYPELELCHPNKEYVAFDEGADLERKLSELPSLSRGMIAKADGKPTKWRRSGLSHLFRRVGRRHLR